MVNPKKNKIIKSVWFLNENEYLELISYLEGNYKEEAFDLLFKIYKRGDF